MSASGAREIYASHQEYLNSHPALQNALHDLLQAILIHKPDDVPAFCRSFFEDTAPSS